jgi:DNA-binding XRE family transcriptional regulator
MPDKPYQLDITRPKTQVPDSLENFIRDTQNAGRLTESVQVPRTGRELILARRRKMLSQEDMAIYLGISRLKLCRMEQEQIEMPDPIAFKAQEILNQYARDCSRSPYAVVRFLQRDGFSYREISSASGIAVTRVKAIGRWGKPTSSELEALLNVPPRPEIRRRGPRAKRRKHV